MSLDIPRLERAYALAREALLAERTPAGYWTGELSTSALSTATAVMALSKVQPSSHRQRIDAGLLWLAEHLNADGGWGDTILSRSNISTTMLGRAAFAMTGRDPEFPHVIARVEAWLNEHAGRTPAQRAEAVRQRYGRDRTFSVPILMTCALAGLVPWGDVPSLPFELACLPQSWYRFARLPVVSYALPALIAIGQCVHTHSPTRNPLLRWVRRLAIRPSLKVLRQIQPQSGGYLEATPLTSFVTLALASIPRQRSPVEQQIMAEAVRFLVESVRPDGSWPIDTNLATWVTTLSVNAFASANDLAALDSKDRILDWLLCQQYRHRHPYTGAEPGGWAWTDLPGGVPDCDDTPGAVIAISHLMQAIPQSAEKGSDLVAAVGAALHWMQGLQNRDGGFPTFCRGWGLLPFDRSGTDLTAHALRAFVAADPTANVTHARILTKALDFLAGQQRPDGAWLPLWFGNQHAPDDINPVYGTARVLAAYRDLGHIKSEYCQRGVSYLIIAQNPDGGWGGAPGCPSSVEETALAVDALIGLASPAHQDSIERGLLWLIEAVESGRFRQPCPIGFYFAKLWYYEKLYPLIFAVAALGRARRWASQGPKKA